MSQAAVAPAVDRSYERSVNPQWVRLLDLMQMHVRYARCTGVDLYTDGGERVVWNDALRLGRRALKTSS